VSVSVSPQNESFLGRIFIAQNFMSFYDYMTLFNSVNSTLILLDTYQFDSAEKVSVIAVCKINYISYLHYDQKNSQRVFV
jgi:hypothetical protein